MGGHVKKVSFVVTVFNKARYLPQVIAALKAQKGDFASEFIFVNDGSSDDSLAFLLAAARGWPQAKVVTQANAGPSSALNAGLSLASGDIIKPVDGDDIIAPDAVTRLIEAMDETGAPVATANVCRQGYYEPGIGYISLFAHTHEDEPPVTSITQEEALRRSIHGPIITPSSVIFTRAALDAIGGADDAVFVQDYSLELRLAGKFPLALISGPCYVRPRNAPGRLSDNVTQTLHDVNFALQRFFEQNPHLPDELLEIAVRRATGRAWHWARRHGGQGYASAAFVRFLAVRARLGVLSPKLLELSREPFLEMGCIRLGSAMTAYPQGEVAPDAPARVSRGPVMAELRRAAPMTIGSRVRGQA